MRWAQPGTSWGGGAGGVGIGAPGGGSGRLPLPRPPAPRARTRPAPLRAGEDVPRGVEVGEAGAAAAGQRGKELQKESVGCTGRRTAPTPPAWPSSPPSGRRPGHQPYRSPPTP